MRHYTKQEVLSCSGRSCPFGKLRCHSFKPEREGTSRTDSHKSDLEKNMDFGILNLISIEAKLNFNAFHRIFLIFTVLNSRFNKNYTKTSQTGSPKREGAFWTGSSSSPIKLSRSGSFTDIYPNGKAETSWTGKNSRTGKNFPFGVVARTVK